MSDTFSQNMHSFLKRYPNYRALFVPGLEEKMKAELKLYEDDGVLRLMQNEQVVDSTEPGFMPEVKTYKPLMILEGFGLGVNLQTLLREAESELKEIVIIEPSFERFCFSLQITDFKQLFENESVHWLVGMPESIVFSSLFEIFKSPPRCFYVKAAEFIPHPKITETHSEYFMQIREEWRSVVAMLERAYGNKEDSQLGLKNVVENTSFIEEQPGVDLIKDAFKGVPAVIASAGPSLKDSIPDLKEAKNKAIIIAVDAAAKVLVDNGITPHFVLSLERIPWTKKFFEPLPEDLASNLVCYPLVPKDVIDSFPGPKWCAYRNQAYFYYIGEQCPKAVLTSSSSVSHMSLRFADHLGCSQIAIVGQDLCYDPKTLQSHSDGVAFEDWSKEKSSEELSKALDQKAKGPLIYIEGNDQKQVPSNSVWYTFLKEFSWEATKVEARVFNCTLGGAKIPNLERSHLAAVLEDWVQKDDLFEDIASAYSSYKKQSLDWKSALKYLEDIQGRLKELEGQAKHLYSNKDVDQTSKEKGLRLLRSTIDQLSKDIMTLGFAIEIQASVHWEIESSWYLVSEDAPDVTEKRLKLLERWFAEMYTAAQESSEILKTAHRSIKKN